MVEVAKVNSVAIDDIAKICGMDVPAGALAEDVEGDTKSALNMPNSVMVSRFYRYIVPAGSEISLASKVLTFDANSLAFAAGFVCGKPATATKLRLYMGGLLMQECGGGGYTKNYVLRDFKALSDSQTCELKAYATGVADLKFFGDNSADECGMSIAVGSVKLA